MNRRLTEGMMKSNLKVGSNTQKPIAPPPAPSPKNQEYRIEIKIDVSVQEDINN